MKLPTSIRIGAADYVIERAKELDGGETMGQFLRDEKLIRYVPMSPDINANTLMHEVLHGLYSCSALDATKQGKQQEERIVTALTNQLMQFMLDNPAFVRYLLWAVKQP